MDAVAYDNGLTVAEAARLAGVSTRKVEKSCEEGIVKKRKYKGRLEKHEKFHVPAETVAYTAVLKNCPGVSLSKSLKKKLWNHLRDVDPSSGSFGVADLGGGVLLDIDEMVGREWHKVRSYLAKRQKYLTSDPEILGGTPVIKGTRITCSSVKGRVDGGDTLDEVYEDYRGEIPREAFEAAFEFETNHPPRGRPPAEWKPWLKHKPLLTVQLEPVP